MKRDVYSSNIVKRRKKTGGLEAAGLDNHARTSVIA